MTELEPVYFNKPAVTGKELHYISEAMHNHWIAGDHYFVKKCSHWFQKKLFCKNFLLTPSCTHALEMAALLLDIKPGDEVIMPSFTFVSCANAFVLRGAKIIFVDIRPKTMNIDENMVEKAITDKTRAIVVVHYAGVACNMDKIMNLSQQHDIPVIEDAAHALMSAYKGKPLGTIGHMGTFSFHETKNYTSGEGGAFVSTDDKIMERAEIIRQKGTNRNKFLRGEVDKYSWVDIGSSYVMSELNAAYLYAQLEIADGINDRRLAIWRQYYKELEPLQKKERIEMPDIPGDCEQNAHIFYIKLKDINERQALIEFLKLRNIYAVFHYVPLHSSEGGKRFGRFSGEDIWTTKESERLLRLPLYYNLKDEEQDRVIEAIYEFFSK